MNFPQYRVDNAGQLEEEEGGRGRDVRILPDKFINKLFFCAFLWQSFKYLADLFIRMSDRMEAKPELKSGFEKLNFFSAFL